MSAVMEMTQIPSYSWTETPLSMFNNKGSCCKGMLYVKQECCYFLNDDSLQQ